MRLSVLLLLRKHFIKNATKQKSGPLFPCHYCKHHEAWGEPQESDSQIMCLGSHGRVEDRQAPSVLQDPSWQQAQSSTDFAISFPCTLSSSLQSCD